MSAAFSAYLNDPRVLGFFSSSTQSGVRYLVLVRDGAGYAVETVRFGGTMQRTPITQELAQDLQDILREEIFNATPIAVGGFDGAEYTLGVKKDGRWLYGSTWEPKPGTVLLQLGRIAQLADETGLSTEELRRRAADVRAAYVNDLRPQNDFEATQAWLRAQAAKRERLESSRMRVEWANSLECPDAGDLRAHVWAKELPQDGAFILETREQNYELYLRITFKDAQGDTRTEFVFLVGYPDIKSKPVPLGENTFVLEELSPVLRRAVLSVCSDPERIERVEAALGLTWISSKKQNETLANARVEFPTTALPTEALRKNLRVQSVPLSERDLSWGDARDAQGRLTHFFDRYGDEFTCAYWDAPPSARAPAFTRIADFEPSPALIGDVVGLRQLTRNGKVVREEGDLGEGACYKRGWGDYRGYYVLDKRNNACLNVLPSMLIYTFLADPGDPASATGRKWVKMQGADKLALPDLLAWERALAGVDASLAWRENALWMVLENRTGKPLANNEKMEVFLEYSALVPLAEGKGGGRILSKSVRMRPILKTSGVHETFLLEDALGALGESLAKALAKDTAVEFDRLSFFDLKLKLTHVTQDNRLSQADFIGDAVPLADMPGLSEALSTALRAARARQSQP